MLRDKRIIVTGGNGFLGSYVVQTLRDYGCQDIIIPRSAQYDLTQEKQITKLYSDCNPDIVIHLAASVGGIGINKKKPGTFFYENAIMGVLLLEYARQFDIEKFVGIGTICSYPKFTPVPFREECLWDGYPEETNAPYGLAKKMLLVQSQAYRDEFQFNSIYLLLVNLYGPRDNFDPESSHVIPAIVKKCIDARNNQQESITCWGTGRPTREFLYVEDAAKAIVAATDKYNKRDPINIGSGKEITISELVELIADLTGYEGKILWDTSKPDGQPRRSLDTAKAYDEFGFRATTDFVSGLRKTIEWYERNGN